MPVPAVPIQPFDLARFDLREMLRVGSEVRALLREARSVEGAARAITTHLYESARHPVDGPRSCALVRCFVTRPLASLDLELRRAAQSAAGEAPLPPATNCLVLLATVGDEPEWRDRRRSRGHRAIPLVSAESVRAAPMIARLINAFGVRIEDLAGAADRERLLHATAGKTYGVFHVEEAAGSPYIPAQADFVERYGIRSVLGFGAGLTTGDVIAVVMFSRTTIPEGSAERFRSIALDLKAGLHRFREHAVFAEPADPVAS